MPCNVWDEIIRSFPNLIGSVVAVLECISNFILHIMVDVIISPC